mmetsp:Transcript_18113/g.36991  ORF Transcript_18113/g.36991 Transcript_18113/m.36991 type:complete len:201 (-) Transcript_18113:95-697(-)|eukprot:CAMPEP_0113819838 /NCGR_PEP_ID=MMETSP0328-20130328/939_1 /TAXON_ID=39455 /ORGANISM="Alexandrium minutum" /LENGTH=200 /DNA_ID=CAMNT_0000787771 /DNA_START=88 /DNA_END=690 /DNA_ORIENTATION=+ /assembly_acc=CAM_ASM_000350
MPDIWSQSGQTMEVSGEGLVLTKTSGGDYPRHVACGELLSSGVHTWEVVINAGSIKNGNRDMKIGVANQGCNVEKGDHHNKGDAWYLRTHDACLYGGDMDLDDQEDLLVGRNVGRMKGKFFLVGDRVGVQLNCEDGSLCFYKNGEGFGIPFPAGTIKGPVVRAVELVCSGQSVTLVPDVELPYAKKVDVDVEQPSSAAVE